MPGIKKKSQLPFFKGADIHAAFDFLAGGKSLLFYFLKERLERLFLLLSSLPLSQLPRFSTICDSIGYEMRKD